MSLVDKEYVLRVTDLPATVREQKLMSLIEDAEFIDVRPLLGEKFYADLVKDPDKYTELLEGKDYEWDGFTYDHPGLKRVIAFFVDARFNFFGADTPSPFGMVHKDFQDGHGIDRARAKELYKDKQRKANEYWLQIKRYLDRNSKKYPYWRCDRTVKGITGFRLTHIR